MGCQDRRRLPLCARGPRVHVRPGQLIEGLPRDQFNHPTRRLSIHGSYEAVTASAGAEASRRRHDVPDSSAPQPISASIIAAQLV